GVREAAERVLPRNQVRLDVVAAGVGRRCELIPAAVEQQGAAGLLADMVVRARVDEGRFEGEGRERGSDVTAAGEVFADRAVVVEGAGLEPVDQGLGGLEVLAHPDRDRRRRRAQRVRPTGFLEGRVFDVFEMDVGDGAVRVDFAVQQGTIRVHTGRAGAF